MKLNKNKIIVSALALVIGTSLAGSVTGTLAWYQYSTRANVSFIGQSSGISGNLQMRFKGETDTKWRTRITWQEMAAQLAANNYADDIVPITFGEMDKNDELPDKCYLQPKYLESDMADWYEAKAKNYAQFTLQLRYNERDGVEEGEQGQEKDEKNIAKDVYLSKLVIKNDSSNTAAHKEDLSDAVRVHISSSYKAMENNALANKELNKLVSKNGGTIATKGKLDLDGDGKNDQAYPENDEFGFEDKNATPTTLQDVVYGDGEQTSYVAGKDYVAEHTYVPYGADQAVADPLHPVLVGETNNKLTDLKYSVGENEFDKKVGSTIAGDENGYLEVTVTIWVEGWQELKVGEDAQHNPIYSAIWDEVKYVDSKFDVGIQFAVQDTLAE